MEINNLKQVTKDLEKFKKAFGDELLMAASERTKQFAQDLYASLKDQLETIVVKSESKSKDPIVARIDTQLVIEQPDPKKPITNISIQTNSKAERNAIIAGCHGTGMGISQEVLSLLADKTGADLTEKDKKDLSDFYIDPSNADTKFEKRFEKGVIK